MAKTVKRVLVRTSIPCYHDDSCLHEPGKGTEEFYWNLTQFPKLPPYITVIDKEEVEEVIPEESKRKRGA